MAVPSSECMLKPKNLTYWKSKACKKTYFLSESFLELIKNPAILNPCFEGRVAQIGYFFQPKWRISLLSVLAGLDKSLNENPKVVKIAGKWDLYHLKAFKKGQHFLFSCKMAGSKFEPATAFWISNYKCIGKNHYIL